MGTRSVRRVAATIGRRQSADMRIDGWHGELGGPLWWARVLGFAVLIGLLLGLIGPFGSYMNGSPLVLALHWIAMTTVGAVLFGSAGPWLVTVGIRHGLPALYALGGAIVILAVPLAVVSALEARWLWPSQTRVLSPADWYVQTLGIAVCVVGFWLVVERGRGTRRNAGRIVAPDIVPAASTSPMGPLLCLQMEDHYVRLHRTCGSTLELMPLQEAIARHGRDGLQVHRGWWVAIAAVAASERDGRNWRLRLTNGLVVPVARNRVLEARAKGVIGGELVGP